MTAVTFQFRENRLGKLVLAPGGVRQDDAMAAAKTNLEGIQDECVAEVDRSFERIRAAATGPDVSGDLQVQREIYAAANRIAGIAGACGLSEMGEAAFSLCELVDRQILSGAWNAKAVAVHVDAMMLLRGRDAQLEPAGRKQILAGLKDVAARARLPAGGPSPD